jgi:hypothetical protein
MIAGLITLAAGSAVAEELIVSVDSASAPATVIIRAPQAFTDPMVGIARVRKADIADQCRNWERFLDFTYEIDWGDDDHRNPTQMDPSGVGPDECSEPLRHVYTAPGTYRIKARRAHLGPRAPEEGMHYATVTITGAPAEPGLVLGDAVGDRVILYQEPLPVEWELSTGAPAELKLELMSPDNKPVLSRTFTNLSYVGAGRAELRFVDVAYDALVRPDMVKARVRATLSVGGRSIVRETRPFILSSEYVSAPLPYSGDTNPHAEAIPAEPNTVAFSHYTSDPDCYGYRIDWGDGSAPDRVPRRNTEGCAIGGIWITTLHKYARPGTYRIQVRTTDALMYSRRTDPEDSPYYQAVTVTVP